MDQSKDPQRIRPGKKEYRTPELKLYGDLGSLTEAMTKLMGTFDGKYTAVPFGS